MPIEIDDSKLQLDEVQKQFNEQVHRQFGQVLSDAVAQIQLRVQSGRDVNNSQFKPYSKEYAKRKAERTGSAATVNLVWSGLMINSIQQRVAQRGNQWEGIIYFANPIAAARAEGNIDNGRDFFGLSIEQEQEIYDRLQEAINL